MNVIARLEKGIRQAIEEGDEDAIRLFGTELRRLQKASFVAEPEDDDRTAFGRGLSGGIDTAGRLFGSSLEGAGRVSGLEGLEEYGAEMVAENEAQLAEQERFRTRLKDVTEGEGTVADFAL